MNRKNLLILVFLGSFLFFALFTFIVAGGGNWAESSGKIQLLTPGGAQTVTYEAKWALTEVEIVKPSEVSGSLDYDEFRKFWRTKIDDDALDEVQDSGLAISAFLALSVISGVASTGLTLLAVQGKLVSVTRWAPLSLVVFVVMNIITLGVADRNFYSGGVVEFEKSIGHPRFSGDVMRGWCFWVNAVLAFGPALVYFVVGMVLFFKYFNSSDAGPPLLATPSTGPGGDDVESAYQPALNNEYTDSYGAYR